MNVTKNQGFELLQQFFEYQAKVLPDKLAIIFNDKKITYHELEKQANQLARYLRSIEIKKGSRVGILLDRSINTYLTMLAIIKAGATYIPIHSDFPLERIQFICKDSSLNLLISSTKFNEINTIAYPPVFLLDQNINLIDTQSSEPITPAETGLLPEDACYIVYTSGTTGTPKGIEISHKAVCNYISAAQQIYCIQPTDRVYQGFSIAFDASIEEIWLTLSAGATLIPGLQNTLQGGIVEGYLNKHQVTVLSCVPTYLSMLKTKIPSLRLLILGGEVCPSRLLKPWYRPGLRIINTYGPTETTVVATYSECHPDKEVNIGRSLPNYEIFIFDEKLKPVKDGEEGELYIAGPGLANGYINRPELDKIKFISHPQTKQRLYRTGDIVKMLSNKELQFIGRADAQIKLRGFRVELTEIENTLLQYPNIKSAAVTVKELTLGDQSLVAYLILENKDKLDIQKLNAFLRNKLPFFMIPTTYELVENFPTLPSGKIDRKNLPIPKSILAFDDSNRKIVNPQNKTEQSILKILTKLLRHTAISVEDDFFFDLNLHSLLVSKFVSKLREKPRFAFISIRDVYENPTIKVLACKIDANKPEDIHKKLASQSINKKSNSRYYYFCSLLQLLGVYLELGFFAWQFVAVFLFFTFMDTSNILAIASIGKLILFLLLINPALFALVIMTKWLVLGRVKSGAYPLWGWFYFRWWLVRQLQTLLPLRILSGSPLIVWYCRLMGAKIGKNCCIRTHLIDSFDLLRMGNHTCIGIETAMLGYSVEDGFLKIGPIILEDRCYVGNNCVLNADIIMHADAKLEDQSMLPAGSIIKENEYYAGSPARSHQVAHDKFSLPFPKEETLANEMYYGTLHFLFTFFMLIRYVLAISPGIFIIDYVYESAGLMQALTIAPLCSFLFIFLYCFITFVMKKTLVGKFRSGKYPVRSMTYLRKWLLERLIASTLETIGSMYATTFAIPFLRSLGTQLGKRVEISTPTYIAPDLLSIGNESFIADLTQLGTPFVYTGYITFASTKIGKRSFIGNSAIIPSGSEIGNHALIGCLSIPPKNELSARTDMSWSGSPAILIPRRENFSQFTEAETYCPSLKLSVQRFVMDTLRAITPNTFIFMTIIFEIYFSEWMLSLHFNILSILLIFPLIYGGILCSFTSLVIALKWLLMGRYKPDVKPAFSFFVFKNEFITGLYDFYLEDLLFLLVGTPFLPCILRLLGAKIGKKVFLDTSCLTEFDLIKIGDYVAINKDATLQTHLFEDRIFKMGNINIENNCNIGTKSIVLYDTCQKNNSTLASLSLLMKGETMLANIYGEGIPAHCKQKA